MIALSRSRHSHARGLAWHIWRHHFRGLGLICGYLALLVTAALLNPKAVLTQETLIALAAIPLTFALLYLMAVFTHPEADIAATGSGYPSHLLILPVRTRDLVLWPMAYGSVALSLTWFIVAAGVFRARGIPAPVLWPAALLAATLSCLQALFWTPISLPYLRLVLAVLLLPCLLFTSVLLQASGVAESIIAALYLSLIPAAYAVALEGVARARRGDCPERSWINPSSAMAERPVRNRGPFRSPARAQLWFEWTRNGIILPLMVGGGCLLASLPLIWVRDSTPLLRNSPLEFLTRGFDVEANVTLRATLFCFLLPVWIASIVGGGVRISANRRNDLSLPAFLAIRPMTTADLVASKLKMAACSTLVAWTILMLFAAVWLMTPATHGAQTGLLIELILRAATPKAVVVVLTTLAVLVFWTWKCMVQSLFVDLIGREWLVEAYRLTLVFGAATILFLFATLAARPELSTYLEGQVLLYMRVAATAKVLIALWALRELWKRRIARPDALAIAVAIWLATATGLFALMHALLPTGAIATTNLALIVVLFLPAARLSLAPLALESNRHR